MAARWVVAGRLTIRPIAYIGVLFCLGFFPVWDLPSAPEVGSVWKGLPSVPSVWDAGVGRSLSASVFGKGTGKIRVISTFFFSNDFSPGPEPMNPAEDGTGRTFSDVYDCASLLLLMLDRPSEPCPSNGYGDALASIGIICTFVPVPL